MRLIGVHLVAALACAVLASCSSPSDVGCSSDAECRDGRVCVDGKCATPGTVNNDNGTANSDNVTPNSENVTPNSENVTPNSENVTPNSENVTPNNENVDPNNVNREDLALCEELCDKLLGSCIDETCDIPADQRDAFDGLIDTCIYDGFEEGEPGCLEAVGSEPEVREELEQLLDGLTCESPELQEFRCVELALGPACGCDTGGANDVGRSCDGNDECDGGGLPGACLDEQNEPPFPDGYCVGIGCAADPDEPRFDPICGDGNVCLQAGMNGVCFEGCQAHADCRPGYQCRLAGATLQTVPIRICLPSCEIAGCAANERCNEGRCEFPCGDGGGQICEALGFACEPDANGVEYCVLP